jgi:hypothetical protein
MGMKMENTAGKSMLVNFRPFACLTLLAFLLTTHPVLAAAEENDEWKYHGTLYVWATEFRIEDSNGNSTEVSVNDLVDNLDLALMGGFGARKDKLGFQIDAIYMDLSNDDNDTLIPGLLTLTDVELSALVLTPMATYRVVEDDQFNLDVLGGVRYLYLDINYKFREISDEGEDRSVTNGIIGFKGDIRLNKNWHMPFYYDIGKGDSELTYQAFAGINYKYDSFDLAAGYRYLKFKFDDDDDFGDSLNYLIVKGPMIGAKIWF